MGKFLPTTARTVAPVSLRDQGSAAKSLVLSLLAFAIVAFLPGWASAGEADIVLPALSGGQKFFLGLGLLVCIAGCGFGIWQAKQLRAMPAHRSMLDVAEVIYSTCKTYLMTQAKLLILLWILIGAIIFWYFKVLSEMALMDVVVILIWSLIGIAGSFGVALFGMRINTLANSRAAFASLRGKPLPVLRIPLQAH